MTYDNRRVKTEVLATIMYPTHSGIPPLTSDGNHADVAERGGHILQGDDNLLCLCRVLAFNLLRVAPSC